MPTATLHLTTDESKADAASGANAALNFDEPGRDEQAVAKTAARKAAKSQKPKKPNATQAAATAKAKDEPEDDPDLGGNVRIADDGDDEIPSSKAAPSDDDETGEIDEPVEPREPKAPAKSEPEKIPDDLIERAKSLGMTDAEAKSFDSADVLERSLRVIERTNKKSAPVTDEKSDDEPYSPSLDPVLYEAELSGEFKRLADWMNKRIRSVTDELNNIRESQATARMDRLFRSLPKQWDETFRTGRHAESNKQLVIDEMKSMQAGYKATGRTVPDESVLHERAVNSVFGNQHQQLARRQVAEQVRNRSGQYTARPTQRNGSTSPVTSRSQAIQRVAERLGVNRYGDEEEFA